LEAEPARDDRSGQPGRTGPDDGEPGSHRAARARPRAAAITSPGTGSKSPEPQRNRPEASSRSHHASLRAPGTQTSCRRCSMARNTAADTALGGSFRPRYVVGLSVLCQISVSIRPTRMTAACTPDPEHKTHTVDPSYRKVWAWPIFHAPRVERPSFRASTR